MGTSKLVLIVTLAAYLLLPCKTAIGDEIACEVDNPHGRCESRSERCIDEHNGEQTGCEDDQKRKDTEANRNWVSASQLYDCPCDREGWSVLSELEAAYCRPDVVNVSFYQHNSMWYIVEVNWKYTKLCDSLNNLVGVQVRLDDGITCSKGERSDELLANHNCCFCVATNHTVSVEGRQNFTVQYFSSISSATATVVTYPMAQGGRESDYATSSDAFTRPTNCYDPRLPADLARCGIPLHDPPTTFRQTYTSTSNGKYHEMNVTLSWDPPNHYVYPSPTHYYVRIRPDNTPEGVCSGDTHCFKVTNSTEITFMHLEASKTYYVKLGAYHRCSGIMDAQDSMWLNGCGRVNTIVMHPYTNLTNGFSAEGEPTSVGNSIAIGASVAAVTSILGTMAVVAVSLFVYYRRRRPRPLPPSPQPPEVQPNDSPSVLVVYSDKTHKKEKAKILQTLIGTLRHEYGILSICHDYFGRSDSIVYKTADYLQQANAVLCVCNPAFTNDWNSERPPPVINTLKQIIAANVSSGGNLSNYATVFLYAQDQESCIPHDFFKNTRQFLITDVEGIVRFVRDVPSIEVVSISMQ